MLRPRTRALIAVPLAALMTGACGRSDPPSAAKAHAPAAVPASATSVIRAWSDTLRAGHPERAARYFATPAIVQFQPDGAITRLRRPLDAIAFNATLPCGATLLSTVRDGRYVNALFRLSDRPGSPCDAPGMTARTDFVVRGGKIVEWRRAADRPGDRRQADPQPAGQTV